LISEAIVPAAGLFDAGPMAAGEPGLPQGFEWRGRTLAVRVCESRWKKYGPGDGGGGVYLRRHYFRLVMEDGEVWIVYCERRIARSTRGSRWVLYTIETPGAP
jgi:hypothetical protein